MIPGFEEALASMKNSLDTLFAREHERMRDEGERENKLSYATGHIAGNDAVFLVGETTRLVMLLTIHPGLVKAIDAMSYISGEYKGGINAQAIPGLLILPDWYLDGLPDPMAFPPRKPQTYQFGNEIDRWPEVL
jgi:hypothetical protein